MDSIMQLCLHTAPLEAASRLTGLQEWHAQAERAVAVFALQRQCALGAGVP